MRRTALAALLCAALACAGCAGLRRDSADAFRVVGYAPDYSLDRTDPAAFGRLTDVILFSVEPTSDGAFPAEALAAAPVARFQEIQRAHGVRVHLCFGGWGRSAGFPPMATDPAKRAAFIAALAAFCREKGFDGVDYDWEFPASREEHAAYDALLIETAQALHPQDREVTVALGWSQTLDPAAYAAVDRIHLMTYDMGARHATHEAATAAVRRLLRDGAPREKICLGLPFYGRKMDHPDTAAAYADLLRDHAPAPAQDEAGGFYFNNAETLRRKTRYALEEGLAGVMIWELSMDTRDDTSLLKAVTDEIAHHGRK